MMLKGLDIICLAGADWDTPLWTNRQHIMSRLSRENRVLYIESIGIRPPNMAKLSDMKRVFKRMRLVFNPLRKAGDNLYILTPLVAPFFWNTLVDRLNRYLLRWSVGEASRKLGFKKPILWSYLPHALCLLSGRKYNKVIYHCVDEYSHVPGVASGSFADMEKEFLKNSDVVFVTSKGLYESKKTYNSNTHYLPNVADFSHFSKAILTDTAVPEDIKGIRGPVIGYVGNLCDHKVDTDLIEYSAKKRKDLSFVLIGPVWENNKDLKKGLESLRKVPNVFILGFRPYEKLPNYIKGFDVCMIPHKVTPYSRFSFPLKLHEFLASGKPVVSIGLPAIEDYAGLVYMADTPDGFVSKIEEALAENDPKKSEERRQAASRNTWEERIRSMEEIMKI